jgi:membrane-bound lytic murein transglycosylase B
MLVGLMAAPAAQEAPRRSFAEFLTEVGIDAAARGISQATIDAAFTGLTPEPVVVTRDRAQPEQALSLDTYVARRVTTRAQAIGREQRRVHRAVLAKVEEAYGVPPSVVVAVWGLESSFGRFTGTYSTVRALATLAYDGRRPLFRTELLSALEIIDRGHATFDRLKGSWAGAMGQPQFMPSSYLKHAVDFDGDGHANIWSSPADVFASTANYLRSAGWTGGERWGREVRIPAVAITAIDREAPMRTEGCRALRALTTPRPLTFWTAKGVTLPNGGALPAADLEASLVRGVRRHFLVYRNYEAFLDYNCSNAYAVSVGVLADRIAVN